MKLHEIADNPGSRQKRTRIGRGIGSGKGKTGGRGGKGQTARSGVRIKGFEGGQMPLHRRLPKRGFKNTAFALKLNEVNLDKVQTAIDAGKLDAAAPVDVAALVKAGVLRRAATVRGESCCLSASKVARTTLYGLDEPSDFATTSWRPSVSNTARIGPPAMMPVPGGAARRWTLPAP